MPTVKETFDAMAGRFRPDKAAGVNATIQYDISGDQGGTWRATIKDGQCTVTSGARAQSEPDAAACPRRTGSTWWAGKLSGQMAFMSGKLKLKGDMGLAMKIGSMFQV